MKAFIYAVLFCCICGFPVTASAMDNSGAAAVTEETLDADLLFAEQGPAAAPSIRPPDTALRKNKAALLPAIALLMAGIATCGLKKGR